ncbi:hypothetical protein [Streptomyces sp. PR69]|uniref:hypothetical protein n=1 Tax=Streptomyces sp. PR69 TaxID=2984950 RepID=UPI0022645C6B|nr:hypothetical protein [Streptomyces sp. PR69]
MSARLVAAAAVTTAAAVGATLVPVHAYAASAAPAGLAALSVELGAPAPDAALERGGAKASFSFTVRNSSDEAVDFRPWLVGESDGASPVRPDQVAFDVSAVNAPETASRLLGEGTGVQGAFFPKGGGAGEAFSVPAGSELSWKVTVGLGEGFPANNGSLKLTAADLNGPVGSTGSVAFKADPAVDAKPLQVWWGNGPEGVIRPGGPARHINVYLRAPGEGGYDKALETRVRLLSPGGGGPRPELGVELYREGSWKPLKAVGEGEWLLPGVPKGFGGGKQESFPLRLTVLDANGLTADTKVTLMAAVSLEGESGPAFAEAEGVVTVGPAAKAPSSLSPSAAVARTAPATTDATDATAPATDASGTAGARAAGSAAAPVSAAGAQADTSAPAATGNLARTGSSSALPLYGGVAAALLAVGAALAFVGIRRRGGARS